MPAAGKKAWWDRGGAPDLDQAWHAARAYAAALIAAGGE